MLLLPVVMRKHAVLLRQHAPQTLGSARICTRFACFIRTRSGGGAARGRLFQSTRLIFIAVANIIIDNVLSTRAHFPKSVLFSKRAQLRGCLETSFEADSDRGKTAAQSPCLLPSASSHRSGRR